MKILFLGLGSIGLRHANILKQNYNHQLYALRSGVNLKENPLGISELHSWQDVEKLKPHIAFITNPTNLHIETAIKCAKLGCALFVEKPIGHNLKNLDKLLRIVKEKTLVTYIAYNLRFHPTILWLKKYLLKHKPLHVRVVCSSYLPSWRPNTNHLKSYSANSKMGGGVILDLSHELDYTSYLFGHAKTTSANFGKVSNVTIDAEDYADILVETKSTPINLHIDFLSHILKRYTQIDFEHHSITADIIKAQIKIFSNNTQKITYLNYQKGREYETQMKFFLKNIKNTKMMNNLQEAAELFRQTIAIKSHKITQ